MELAADGEHLLQALFFDETVALLQHLAHIDFLRSVFSLTVEHDDALHPGQTVDDAAHFAQLVAADDDVARVAVVQTEEQIAGFLQFDGEGHVDGAGVEHRQLRDDPQVAPLGEQCHVVSAPDAEGLQACAETVDLPLHFFVSRAGPFLPDFFEQEGVIGECEHRVLECVYQCFLHTSRYESLKPRK